MFHAIVIFLTLASFQNYAARSAFVDGGSLNGMYVSLTANGSVDRVMSVLGPDIVFDIVDKPSIAAFNDYHGGISYASAAVPASGLFQDHIEMLYGNFLIVSVYSGCLCNEVYTVDGNGSVNAVYGNIQNGNDPDQAIRNARGLRKFTFASNPSEQTYLADHASRAPTRVLGVQP